MMVGKTLKPYQGLKQHYRVASTATLPARKNPKTLSGIETFRTLRLTSAPLLLGKTLKPYQGLKLSKSAVELGKLKDVTKTLKPYQGLKL